MRFDHPVFALATAAATDVRGELELASQWAGRPFVAVTGTNGKTTVTTLITEMLVASEVRAVAAGNIGLARSDAVASDAEVFVVEASSFQLQLTDTFRPSVAVWLNAAPDHLDIHGTFDAYAAAKARIWANQGDGDVAVVNADDPVVDGGGADGPGGSRRSPSGAHPATTTSSGTALIRTRDGLESSLPRRSAVLPHDVSNALAAARRRSARRDRRRASSAPCSSSGPPPPADAGRRRDGVRWYDDSKATDPHAALAAIGGFDSVVLIAGGRNKGLDLGALARPPTESARSSRSARPRPRSRPRSRGRDPCVARRRRCGTR